MKQKKWFDLAWWLGAPFAIGLLTWGPYWLRNVIVGRAPWFRIPVLTGTVFDVMAYLQPIGQAVAGGASANLIGPFAPLMRLIASAWPGASVPEAWFVARWIATTAALWIGAWCLQRWSGLGRNASRFLSTAFWFSFVLVLGMKPGFASWLLPFGMFGIASVLLARDRLREKRVAPAVVWSALAVASSSLYAWYFLFVVVWLGIEWFLWLARASKRLAAVFFVLGAVAASVFAVLFAFWAAQTPDGITWLELMQRLSLSYTRMIFVSSSALLTALWAALFVPLILRATDTAVRERASVNATAWLALLFTFGSSPFTGHYIQNDHFRSSAAVLSWFSLAAVWSVIRNSPAPQMPNAKPVVSPSISLGTGSAEPCQNYLRFIPLATFLISAAYVLRILAAPMPERRLVKRPAARIGSRSLRPPGSCGLDDWKTPMTSRTFYAVILAGSLVIGGNAAAAMYAREFSVLPKIERLVPVIDWIKTTFRSRLRSARTMEARVTAWTTYWPRTRPRSPFCSYHFVSSRTRRGVSRPHASRFGFYDVRGAGDEGYWELQSSLNQFIVCEQYPLQTKLFRALGLPQDRIDALIGCPRRTIDARWNYVKDAIDRPNPDAEAFKRICPYVVMPDDKKSFWRLPEGYLENRVLDGVSIFSSRP